MTTLPPTPEAVIELAKWGCSKKRYSTNRCQRRRAGLLCTDLWSSSDDSVCENQHDDDQHQYDEDESDEDKCSDEWGSAERFKEVYVSLSGILKKTINFHETLPQENEFLSKCRHYWRTKSGLFFMSASCCLLNLQYCSNHRFGRNFNCSLIFMLRGHMAGIIHTYCLKQMKSLEFHIVAKFANLHYTLNVSIEKSSPGLFTHLQCK